MMKKMWRMPLYISRSTIEIKSERPFVKTPLSPNLALLDNILCIYSVIFNVVFLGMHQQPKRIKTCLFFYDLHCTMQVQVSCCNIMLTL